MMEQKCLLSGYVGNDSVNEYTLTTGFDVSTATFVDSLDMLVIKMDSPGFVHI